MTRTLLIVMLTALIALTTACGGTSIEPAGGQPTGSDEPPQSQSRSQPASTTAPVQPRQPASTRAPYATTYPYVVQDSEAASSGSRSAPSRQSQRGREPARRNQPQDTTFQDYGRQPMTDTDVDNMSTFSLDTDRTSFQLALTWAKNGYQIEPDSVRAEEWINSFQYDYPEPEDQGSFSINTDIFEHPLDHRLHMARIGFQAPELLDATPLNVTLVLDASGSMADGNRVKIAREAAEAIRESLSSKDRIAVVHFTDYVLEQHTVSHEHPKSRNVGNSIKNLQPHGSTNVQAGLNEGVFLADQARLDRPNSYNYIILMSDGVANVDATNPFAILQSSPDYDEQNPLRLITIGVGIDNYNDTLLEQLAQHGNGWYRYLDNTKQAQETFERDNWLALSTPSADQTRAQVSWDPDLVRAWRIIGYENRITSHESFTQARKEFAELYSGAATTVFYELELWQDAATGRNKDIGTVELRWTDPATRKPWRQHTGLSGNPNTAFGNSQDPLTSFGAIIGLTADRYATLNDFRRDDLAHLHDDLTHLEEKLGNLKGKLGRLQAYKDFDFVLNHLTKDVQKMVPRGRRDYEDRDRDRDRAWEQDPNDGYSR